MMDRLAFVIAVCMGHGAACTLGDSGGHPQVAIDVLERLDPKRDTLQGAWTLGDRVLRTDSHAFSLQQIHLPLVPGDEYDLRIVATRKGARGSLTIGLALGAERCTVDVDHGRGGDVCGLSCRDGEALEEGGGGRLGPLLVAGKPAIIRCSVRKGGIRATVDGRIVVDWVGDPRRLSCPGEWARGNPRALFLGCRDGDVEVSSLRLTCFSPEGGKSFETEDPRARAIREAYEEQLRRERQE